MARLFAAFALLQLLALTAQVGGGAHVLIVGVEGAGHHTICNGMLSPPPAGIARVIIGWSPHIFLRGDHPDHDPDRLRSKILARRRRERAAARAELDSGKKKKKKEGHTMVGSTIYCSNSFPMGEPHVLTRHPDVDAFLNMAGVDARVIFVYRDLVRATQSSMKRFRAHRNFSDELLFTRESQNIIDGYFNRSCTKARHGTCYTVAYDKVCANDAQAAGTIKIATGATGDLYRAQCVHDH